jgi:hypothetical protein
MKMRAMSWASLGAALWLAAGCATGDSSATDVYEPGLEASVEASAEGGAVDTPPPMQAQEAGAVQTPGEPDASTGGQTSAGSPDASRADASSPDASYPDASYPDTSYPVTQEGGASATIDAAPGEGGDSAASGDTCPSSALYAAEAAVAAFNHPTLCPTGTCPSAQCCYSVTLTAVCVAR